LENEEKKLYRIGYRFSPNATVSITNTIDHIESSPMKNETEADRFEVDILK